MKGKTQRCSLVFCIEAKLTSSGVDEPRSLLEVLDRLEVDETSSLIVKRAVDGNDVALWERNKDASSSASRSRGKESKLNLPEQACPQVSRLVGTSKRRKRAWEEARSRTEKRGERFSRVEGGLI